MLVDEIYNAMAEYGHFVDTEEDLFELEKSTIENSNKKDDDYYKSIHSIETFVEQRIQTKASQLEQKMLFIHITYLIGIGFLCYKLYIS